MFSRFNSLHYVQLNTMIDSPRLFATNNLEQLLLKQIAWILCSIDDEAWNVRQVTRSESGNIMGKIVMDTSGNVYSPDRKSNVYIVSAFEFNAFI
jgi:hypothetical protein